MCADTAISSSQVSSDQSGPDFSVHVPQRGYHWWYVDAFSNDHQYGLTIIAFIGSVFSPYYAWSRDLGRGDPYQHCAINVSLYGKGGKRWSMTERTREGLVQSTSQFQVGPSSLTWKDEQLLIDIDEITVPFPSSLRGRITLSPRAVTDAKVRLDDHGHHHWWPIAPLCDVEVSFSNPTRSWTGTGYFDSNWGTEPLEAGFQRWDWSRANLSNDRSVVLYDVTRRDGTPFSLARLFQADGTVEDIDAPTSRPISKTLWRVDRATQSDEGTSPKVLSTLEDAPFYARSMVESSLLGERVTAMHESLDLDRFASKWVQVLLPFKMPRRRR